MSRTVPAFVILLAGLSAAGEPETELERLRVLRLAMEAKLKTGDALLAAGDRQGALAAYREATALFEGAAPAPLPEPRAAAPRPVAAALRRALDWLAARQRLQADGGWSSAEGLAREGRFDVGVTGLALLALAGAGGDAYAENVAAALRFLEASQGGDGLFGPRSTQHAVYNHAIATYAVCEAYAATREERLREAARRGVDWILAARNPYLAWRYSPRAGENDTSVTGWCVLALAAAERAGLAVDRQAFEGALAWVEKMTDPETGRVGYVFRGGTSARTEGLQDRFPAHRTEAMTASGMLTRLLCGAAAGDPALARGARLLAKSPPAVDPQARDYYYWFFGARALGRLSGDALPAWRNALRETLGRLQEADGSFPPSDAWSAEGGRVYATAICALALQAAADRP